MHAELARPIASWYAAHARALPWRDPAASPWAILVSEIMLQQTPVARVLPAYQAWLHRWPEPAVLSQATAADAVRQWGRLGYPRRALRLHATARLLVARHGGQVPGSVEQLRALPGVGPYTAAAVASFAFGQRHPVLDVNVRRVLARLVAGADQQAGAVSAAEVALAESLLPADGPAAAAWSVAVMELGALLCRPARPACTSCPVAARCAWLRDGRPRTARTPQARYAGSDRQCRGELLAALRAASGPIPAHSLEARWPAGQQRARVLQGLAGDGLVILHGGGMIGLPGEGIRPASPLTSVSLAVSDADAAGLPVTGVS